MAKEIDQARYIVRANLITLGEGYRCNLAFYNHDFPSEQGYGFYYNLNSDVYPFGSDKTGPKPIVPAYAAMTFLLEGHKSAGSLGLSGTSMGYRYLDSGSSDTVLAVWNYSSTPEVEINVGVSSVTQYDWMGNSQTVSTPSGVWTVTLGPSPIYAKY